MAPEDNGTLVPNGVWYQVYKPAGLLNAAGQPNYELIGQHTNIQAATMQAQPVPGAAIVMLCCLFINPAAAVVPAAALAS